MKIKKYESLFIYENLNSIFKCWQTEWRLAIFFFFFWTTRKFDTKKERGKNLFNNLYETIIGLLISRKSNFSSFCIFLRNVKKVRKKWFPTMNNKRTPTGILLPIWTRVEEITQKRKVERNDCARSFFSRKGYGRLQGKRKKIEIPRVVYRVQDISQCRETIART